MNRTTNDAQPDLTASGLHGWRPRMTPVKPAAVPSRQDERPRAEPSSDGSTVDASQAASTAALAELAAGVAARHRQIRHAEAGAAGELRARNAHD